MAEPAPHGYPPGLEAGDRPLWDAALAALRGTYLTGRHEVAAAVRMEDGRIHVGVHMGASAGRTSVCAESAALAAALVATDPDRPLAKEVDTVLAVLYRPDREGTGHVRIISACGLCREVLNDYCPDAWNYIHDFDGPGTSIDVPPPGPGPRGFAGEPLPMPGRAVRVKASSLLPGSISRVWA